MHVLLSLAELPMTGPKRKGPSRELKALEQPLPEDQNLRKSKRINLKEYQNLRRSERTKPGISTSTKSNAPQHKKAAGKQKKSSPKAKTTERKTKVNTRGNGRGGG